ncbi:STAS domain-containing protein [Nocardioides sp. Bht2]|uniref:STAS domain-containing protein n=1 Tax=Nocardioides sp. Bht2 TaxID=3392297 RepID=UPI0039B4CFE1
MDIISTGETLRLAGEFDVRSTTEVRDAIHQHLFAENRDLTIDLTEVTVVDQTALRVLAAATRLAERRGRQVILRGAGPAVRRMLHITHLIRVVELERAARIA